MIKYKNIYQSPFALTFAFIFVTTVILVIGLRYYNNQKGKFKKEKYDEISAIAELKANQLITWRKERLGDAYVISEDYSLISSVKNWLMNQGDINTQKEIERRLRSFLNYYQYKDVLLLEENGAIKISLNESHKNQGDKFNSLFKESAKERASIFSDIINSESDTTLELNIITPLFSGQKLIGGIIFCIDPGRYLFPLIQSWPTPSKSSESLLIKREGNEVVFLNELRHRSNTALKFRIKIDSANIDIPSVASYFGKEGLFEGIDYRGVPVLSNIKKIPGSDWILITKIDLDEIYTPINEKSIYIGIFIGLLILFFGSGTYGLWLFQKRSNMLEHLQMENEKQALKKHFEYLVKHANDIIILSDKNQLITVVNERAINSYGYSEDEMTKMSVKDLYAMGYFKDEKDIIDKVESEKGYIFESVHHRKDNSNFPVEVSIRLIDIDGKKYYQRIIRDIMERKKAEEEIRTSEEKFRLFFENSPVGKSITGLNGTINVNKAFCDMLGYSESALKNTNWKDVTHPDDIQETADIMKAFLEGKRDAVRYEKRYIHKNGNIVWTDVSSILQRDEFGKPLYFMTSMIDITEHRKAENEIIKLNEELELRVEKRTAQLEAANKELEAFSYSVSHDLRTPLRALDGFSKILLEEYSQTLDSEGIRLLNIITDNSRNMGELIDDLLRFSRLSRQEIKKSNTDMRTVANNVFEELTKSIDTKNIKFILNNIPSGDCDASMMRQVWRNLINNALKFTSTKPERIIEIGSGIGNSEYIYYIKDNGVGFDMRYVDKLFGVFQRLHSRDEFEGTGVGLAIVQRIIHKEGGRVWAESILDDGAKFYFTLPIIKDKSI
jgi:PAS domain S-box-containing protein